MLPGAFGGAIAGMSPTREARSDDSRELEKLLGCADMEIPSQRSLSEGRGREVVRPITAERAVYHPLVRRARRLL